MPKKEQEGFRPFFHLKLWGKSLRSCTPQGYRHFLIPTAFRMLEWSEPVMVSQIHIGAMLDQQVDDLLMSFAAIAQDDGFQQGCPAETIDVIDIDIGVGQQFFDDLDMAAVCRRDQTRSAKAVGALRIRSRSYCSPDEVELAMAAVLPDSSVALMSAPSPSKWEIAFVSPSCAAFNND